ncbi:hypothetical protein [Ancylobacter sp. SL191]|uniref:hypothetical protein n=1 Tax=Ancylobacter sp. SL191 TaxID=2995166 RepID=UPI0022700718|nr:hypothetical protein [Ancylobacter sp. SL191]WAC26426.1 hypothetical protein OU996_15575 [Ancylobacter sp. SL191]
MDEATRLAFEALAKSLGDEKARNDAQLIMISAILNALRETHIGAFNTARMFLRLNEKQLVQSNTHGATIRELQLVLREVFAAEPYGPQAKDAGNE